MSFECRHGNIPITKKMVKQVKRAVKQIGSKGGVGRLLGYYAPGRGSNVTRILEGGVGQIPESKWQRFEERMDEFNG